MSEKFMLLIWERLSGELESRLVLFSDTQKFESNKENWIGCLNICSVFFARLFRLSSTKQKSEMLQPSDCNSSLRAFNSGLNSKNFLSLFKSMLQNSSKQSQNIKEIQFNHKKTKWKNKNQNFMLLLQLFLI